MNSCDAPNRFPSSATSQTCSTPGTTGNAVGPRQESITTQEKFPQSSRNDGQAMFGDPLGRAHVNGEPQWCTRHLTRKVLCLRVHLVTQPPLRIVFAKLPHVYLPCRCFRCRFWSNAVYHRPITGVRSPRSSLCCIGWVFRCGSLAKCQSSRLEGRHWA